MDESLKSLPACAEEFTQRLATADRMLTEFLRLPKFAAEWKIWLKAVYCDLDIKELLR